MFCNENIFFSFFACQKYAAGAALKKTALCSGSTYKWRLQAAPAPQHCSALWNTVLSPVDHSTIWCIGTGNVIVWGTEHCTEQNPGSGTGSEYEIIYKNASVWETILGC